MSFHELLSNVHTNIKDPTPDGESYFVKGPYKYYHYSCDDFVDIGWGCGYRTLQTICSWIKNNMETRANIPAILDIQNILVRLEDKPKHFLGSKDWIGCVEACFIIDQLFDVRCKIIHIHSGRDLKSIVDQLVIHFRKRGSPIMMGGDKDSSSKGIFGIHVGKKDIYLLVVDPHFVGEAKNVKQLQDNFWVKWQKLTHFIHSSFYNFCLPQLTGSNAILK